MVQFPSFGQSIVLKVGLMGALCVVIYLLISFLLIIGLFIEIVII